MKNKLMKISLLCLSLCAVLAFSGCKESPDSDNTADTSGQSEDSLITDTENTAVDFDNFDPDAFAEYIPNENAKVLFFGKIFTSPQYLYFCTSEADPKELMVYYTEDYGKTVDRLDATVPEEFTYDSLVPIYMGGGGGSGECEFIVKLVRGDEETYISFNNFHYTDASNHMDFRYGGVIDASDIEQRKKAIPQNFYIEELLTKEIRESAPVGIYTADGAYQCIVLAESELSDSALFGALGIEQGKNITCAGAEMVKLTSIAGDECSVKDKYYLHTKSGDILLTESEVVKLFTLADVPVASEPFYVTDEFGNCVSVKVHTYGGEILPVHAEAYDLKVDGKYVALSSMDNMKFVITTLQKGHINTMEEVYIPLTATLKALGYDVQSKDGTITASGETSYNSDDKPYGFYGTGGDVNYVLSVEMPDIIVNGHKADYKGRVLYEMQAMSSMTRMYSYNDIYMYEGRYYIKPEFLAPLLHMDTDYVSEFYTWKDESFSTTSTELISEMEKRWREWEKNGGKPKTPYNIEITDMATPVTLHLNEYSEVTALSAYGFNVPFKTPRQIYGNCRFDLFEYDGAIITGGSYYSVGDVYVITRNGYDALYKGDEYSVRLMLDGAVLKYFRVHNDIASIVQTGISSKVSHGDVIREYGFASIENGKIVLDEPYEIVRHKTVAETK